MAQEDIAWRCAPDEASPPAAPVSDFEHATPDKAAHVVLRFLEPLDAAARQQLADAGVRLLAPLGENAYFATSSDATPIADKLVPLLASTSNIRHPTLLAARAVQRAHKLHPLLAAGHAPAHAIVGKTHIAGEPEPVDVVAVYALFFADVPLPDAAAIAERHGAVVIDELETVNGLVLELPRTAIGQLADEDAVQWLEPALPPLSADNDSNRALTEADVAQSPPYDLDGAGVTVLVYDAGTARATHVDFDGRLFVRDGSGMNYHSTHVAGTIGGDGTASGGVRRGMAPGVILESFGLQGGGMLLYTNPGDLESDYGAAVTIYGADLANSSIGTNVENNGLDCAIQGDYGVTSALIDSIVSGSLGAPVGVVWAAGNERYSSRCDVEGYGDYYSMAPPSCAKNSIVVGAVNSNDDSMYYASSWGPCDDGRLKPDIVAPGCQNGGDGGVTSCDDASDTAYTTLCGTSMATPTVTGLAALLLEDYRNQFPGAADPQGATIKALFAHNAEDRGNVGPDYQFGYGSVRIVQTIDFMRTGNFLEDRVDQGGTSTTFVIVDSPSAPLKVTLAWDDVPGTPNVIPALVNDLDLVVRDPAGVQYFPWTLDPLTPSAAAVRTKADHLNNIEQVLVDSPMAGVWTIEVHGFNVAQGPQTFALCASPTLVPDAISISFPAGIPEFTLPGQPVAFDVQIEAAVDSPAPGSELLHYRFDGGTFQAVALTALGGGLYEASLPAPACSDAPELYVSAESAGGAVVTNPRHAPDDVISLAVGSLTVPFADDFETDQGWTVSGTATDGQWERGVPVDGGRGDPPTDYDGSGSCYVTDNVAGNSDLDGGNTILTSPVFDMSTGGTVSYPYWLNDIPTGAIGPEDSLSVQMATDAAGTNWQTLRMYGTAGAAWRTDSIAVGTEIAASATMRIRFIALDADPGDVLEAGIDAVVANAVTCTDPLLGDLDGDGDVDIDDYALLGGCLGGAGQPPSVTCSSTSSGDLDGDGDCDLHDYAIFATAIASGS